MPSNSLPPFEYEHASHIARNAYIVRTRSGFEQALRHWHGEMASVLLVSKTQGYPAKYPALVHFTDGEIGYFGFDAKDFHPIDTRHVTVNCSHIPFEKVSDGVYRILTPHGVAQALGDWVGPEYRNRSALYKYVHGVPRTFPAVLKFERIDEPMPKVIISIINTSD